MAKVKLQRNPFTLGNGQTKLGRENSASFAAIAVGIVGATEGNSRTSRIAGHGAIIAGAGLLQQSYSKQDQSLSRTSKLRELSDSLEAELEPSIVDLQDRSVTITGSVTEQFQEWRNILKQMFLLEASSGDLENSKSDLTKGNVDREDG